MNTLITDKHNQRSTGFLACVHSLERLCYLFFLFTSPLCWGEANTPTRDYKMVDLKNGFTTELLEIGKTSFTFSVKWQPDMEILNGWLYLVGKPDLEEGGWNFKTYREVDQALGKATLEILYKELLPSSGGGPDFSQKGFFSVITPDQRKVVEWEDDDDAEEEEKAPMVVTAEAEVQDGKKDETPSLSFVKGKMPKADGTVAGQDEAVSTMSRVWLYASIFLVALCAVFYVVRKKTRT